MDSYDKLPDAEIKPVSVISKKFLELGIKSFKEACMYVHDVEYGYNTDYDDKMIFFKEKKGTCTSKHAIIAQLAKELDIPMQHCFLVYKDYRFDLTEGNCNGKNSSIENFIYTEKVKPFISQKDEYLLYKKVLKDKILPSKEMEGVSERNILKAREEAIILLKENIKKQRN